MPNGLKPRVSLATADFTPAWAPSALQRITLCHALDEDLFELDGHQIGPDWQDQCGHSANHRSRIGGATVDFINTSTVFQRRGEINANGSDLDSLNSPPPAVNPFRLIFLDG